MSKRNGLSLLALGLILMLITVMASLWFWPTFKLQMIFVILVNIIVILIGLVKVLEPKISYKLTPKNVLYIHKHGYWQIFWTDIIRIGKVNSSVGLTQQELPFLGIKLTNLHYIAEHITPRLANRLLHEQNVLRQLIMTTGNDTQDTTVISFEPYELNGKCYKGPIAAWLFRSEQLARHYGYHLYLPIDSFDRTSDEFLSLLRECWQYTKTHEDS